MPRISEYPNKQAMNARCITLLYRRPRLCKKYFPALLGLVWRLFVSPIQQKTAISAENIDNSVSPPLSGLRRWITACGPPAVFLLCLGAVVALPVAGFAGDQVAASVAEAQTAIIMLFLLFVAAGLFGFAEFWGRK
jgi:hypothetical protein